MKGKIKCGHQKKNNTDKRQPHEKAYYITFQILVDICYFLLHNQKCLGHYGSYAYKPVLYS